MMSSVEDAISIAATVEAGEGVGGESGLSVSIIIDEEQVVLLTVVWPEDDTLQTVKKHKNTLSVSVLKLL